VLGPLVRLRQRHLDLALDILTLSGSCPGPRASSTEEIVRIAEMSIPLLEELHDELGLAKAWWLRSEADVIAGRWAARAEALERALVHAKRASDPREISTIIALLAQALRHIIERRCDLAELVVVDLDHLVLRLT